MCWAVEMMRALGGEYPELRKLALKEAKADNVSSDEEWDELGEAAGMWFDYGTEEFQNPEARQKVATSLISFLREQEERRQKWETQAT